MRKHAALRIGPIALLLGVGCAELLQPGEVLIRVRNTGNVDFERVTLGFPSQTELYGSLARAETTPYRLSLLPSGNLSFQFVRD